MQHGIIHQNFYETADKMYHPKELEETMGTITSRLKEGQFVA